MSDKIEYFVTTEIWLHLEPYYNKGIKPEEVKEIIEKMRDWDGLPLQCEKMGINYSWVVKTISRDKDSIQSIVDFIQIKLEDLLRSMGGK